MRLFGECRIGDQLEPLVHDVTASTVVLGAIASRDWRPMHHDYHYATTVSGVRDIFLSTPSQAAWLERYVTDRFGHRCRLGSMSFRMLSSIFPGARMVLAAVVNGTWQDQQGCGWVKLAARIEADNQLRTTCTALVAVPIDQYDNPWDRRGPSWGPAAALAAIVSTEGPASPEHG